MQLFLSLPIVVMVKERFDTYVPRNVAGNVCAFWITNISQPFKLRPVQTTISGIAALVMSVFLYSINRFYYSIGSRWSQNLWEESRKCDFQRLRTACTSCHRATTVLSNWDWYCYTDRHSLLKLLWQDCPYSQLSNQIDAASTQNAGIYVVVESADPQIGMSSRFYIWVMLYVTPEQSVSKGKIIGISGNTGRSTGPNLYYEMIPGGEEGVAPKPYIMMMSTCQRLQ